MKCFSKIKVAKTNNCKLLIFFFLFNKIYVIKGGYFNNFFFGGNIC